MKREQGETIEQFRERRREQAKAESKALSGTVVAPGSPLPRNLRRHLLKMTLPHDVDILISAIAERCADYTKDQLKLIYLTETDYRQAGAVLKFRKLLEYCETGKIEDEV